MRKRERESERERGCIRYHICMLPDTSLFPILYIYLYMCVCVYVYYIALYILYSIIYIHTCAHIYIYMYRERERERKREREREREEMFCRLNYHWAFSLSKIIQNQTGSYSCLNRNKPCTYAKMNCLKKNCFDI